MNRGDVHLCQGKNGKRLGRNNALGLLAILLLAVLLTACTDTDPTSTEPTDYLISSGEHKISYLTDDHPDVKEVTELVAQFLAIDQTQDYNSPDYSELWGLVDQRLLDNRKSRGTDELKEHSISKQLKDFKIKNILITGSRLKPSMAIVTTEISVVYTSVATEYAEKNAITLNEPNTLSVSITLFFKDNVSSLPNPLRPQVDPYGWSISSADYQHVSP